MSMRKPYKTKKRKKEFEDAYRKIGSLNRHIENLKIERDCFIENDAFDEAIDRQKLINEFMIELLKMGKGGWDISYCEPQVTGLNVVAETPKLI